MDEKIQYRPGRRPSRGRLAHAYVPFQHYSENYSPEEALQRGTLFPELFMPYRPDDCNKGYF